MTETDIIAKYNALDGKKVKKAELKRLCADAVSLAEKSEATREIKTAAANLKGAIIQLNGSKSAIINITKPIVIAKGKAKQSPKPKAKSSKSKVLKSRFKAAGAKNKKGLSGVCNDAGRELRIDNTSRAGRTLSKCKVNPTGTRVKSKKPTPKKEPEGTITLAPGLTISIDDIPKETAKRAFYWTSFDPEGRGERSRKDYLITMEDDFKKLNKLADTPEKKELLIEEFRRYNQGYIKRYIAHLGAHSRVASAMITGPANFPTASNRKKSDTADKRLKEVFEFQKKAFNAIEKKINPGIAPIVSGSSDAMKRLQEKLEKEEAWHNEGLAVNKILRKATKSNQTEIINKLRELGLSEDAIKELHNPRVSTLPSGWLPYFTSNSGARIRELKRRIELEKRNAEKAADGNKEHEINGVNIVENFEENRLQLLFDGKPDSDTIKELKSNGFRWSPRHKAWQRQLTNNARWAVKRLSFLKEEESKPKEKTLELAGFTRLDQSPPKPADTFTLPGTVGQWLGEQQRYRLVISLDGETHGGKSELAKQIVNSMATHGFNIAWNDLEQGGLTSKDTAASFARNVDTANQSKIFVIGEADNGIETIKEQARNPNIDVIAIDSGTKLNTNYNGWIDELRVEFPNKIFVVIWQQTQEGKTRGGSGVNFDAPVHIKVYRPDHGDYKKNYAEFLKNRGNPDSLNLKYRIADKKTFTNQENEQP